ncbi:MAG: DUF4198 domain-containing protein [Halieaceae bacterium]|jgi:hypothetical protein|nr:DUF4198 domain-containing protein [Halieaceae bacterium]
MKALATPRKRSLALLGGALLSASVQAHETWMLPGSFSAEPGESLEFTLTSGMSFPSLGSGIDQRRIMEAVMLQHEEPAQTLVPSRALEGALELTGIPDPGLVCAWVQLRPRILQIDDPDDVEHYLDEIGVAEALRESWEADDSLWRESYSKVARSYLRAGDAQSGQGCIEEPTAARFDILPLADPTTLSPGDRLPLQVLFDGEPLAGQAVGTMREGESAMPLQRSDESGRLEVSVAAGGRHMIYATNLRKAAGGDDFNWESDFITLTFDVATGPSGR